MEQPTQETNTEPASERHLGERLVAYVRSVMETRDEEREDPEDPE